MQTRQFSSGTPTSYGELLVDPYSGLVFTSGVVPVAGQARHSISVPNDLSLVGIGFQTQGFRNGMAPGLCNALDVVLGFQRVPVLKHLARALPWSPRLNYSTEMVSRLERWMGAPAAA